MDISIGLVVRVQARAHGFAAHGIVLTHPWGPPELFCKVEIRTVNAV
jgi:hypothetical protein